MRGRVLIIAGSDSGGGAGIQADIKSVTALGGFAMTAITALTAQNTRGVFGVLGVETGFVTQQIELVLEDLGADAIKTGMLHSVEVIETVAGALDDLAAGIPLVADPVMVAKGGSRLLNENATDAVISQIVPRAHVLTPNAPEAEALTGIPVHDEDGQRRAGERLIAMGAQAALVKGGHLDGPEVVDLLVTTEATYRFSDTRIDSVHTHGTGCTLASSIATGMAQGLDLPVAVDRARRYVRAAILAAPGYGHGHGPLDHGVTVDPGRLGE